jgi:uncharacterized protein with ParB-like and HNH nuclease domain
MDLKGAEIRNFYHVTEDVPTPAVPAEWPKDVRIPLYQRPYRWSEPQISKLIKDYQSEPGKSYFSGSIVTVNNVSKNVHELIDGQQRYTTIYLVNYVGFLLSRVLLREAIQTQKVKALDSIVASLKKSSLYLFKQLSTTADAQNASSTNEIYKAIECFAQEIDEVFDLDEPSEEDINRLLVGLTEISALPLETIQTDSNYIDECRNSFEDFLADKTLRLEYDRPIFNARLKTALTCMTITLSSQEHIGIAADEATLSNDANLDVYVDAVRTIFEEFAATDTNSSPFTRAKNVLEKIAEFLNGIMLCVVQTGNPRDAFTLFEVLNDRSLALSELDLIKNQFYRTYVLANQGLSDLDLDNTLQSIDDLWVQGIFDGEGPTKSDLISYLAIVYLSGSPTATHKKQESIRDALANYLKKNSDNYSKNDLVQDINVFSYCKAFIRFAGLKFNGSEGEALRDVYDRNRPLLYQVASYLLANNQESVLAGLVCYTIKLLTDGHKKTLTPEEFEKQLTITANDPSSPVHSQAKYLWQSSILSKDATIPRAKAVSLIERNHIQSSLADSYLQAASAAEFDEFESWINNWSYHDPGSGKFKIRYLFAKIIGLSLVNNQLSQTQFHITINSDEVKKLHLDHMEAKSPDTTHLQDYFQHPEREYYVQGLGNMMPIPGQQNIKKGNQPFYPAAFDAIKKSGFPQSHFLYALTEQHFAQNNSNNVPNEEFFKQRKSEIISLFKQAIAL